MQLHKFVAFVGIVFFCKGINLVVLCINPCSFLFTIEGAGSVLCPSYKECHVWASSRVLAGHYLANQKLALVILLLLVIIVLNFFFCCCQALSMHSHVQVCFQGSISTSALTFGSCIHMYIADDCKLY